MKDIPKLYSLSLDEINEVMILGIIKSVSSKREFVITPLGILGVSGFPIANQTEILNNKPKIRKIKNILIDLKNQELIKKRKSKQDYRGIKETAYNLIKQISRNKSLEQLENDYWNKPSEYPTKLVKRCFQYRKIKLSELTIEQVRLMISQKIGIQYLIGIALEKLEQNIVAEGDLYEGDLLDSVSKLPTEFWNKKPTEFHDFRDIVESNTKKIKTELGEKVLDRISERIKASC